MHLGDRAECAHAVAERVHRGFVVAQPPRRATEHEPVRDVRRLDQPCERVDQHPHVLTRLRRAQPEHVGGIFEPEGLQRVLDLLGRRGARPTPLGTTRSRSREMAVCVAISSALNSETVMTTSARSAAARNPRSWNQRPRVVKVSGIVIGAASWAVTTSGTRPRGGTASDGAWTRSTAPTRRAGPNRPVTCHAS